MLIEGFGFCKNGCDSNMSVLSKQDFDLVDNADRKLKEAIASKNKDIENAFKEGCGVDMLMFNEVNTYTTERAWCQSKAFKKLQLVKGGKSE